MPLIVRKGRRLFSRHSKAGKCDSYYFMWNPGASAADQCEGCSFYTSQVRELSFVHFRDVTYATFCQGPYAESIKYRDFMRWDMPWYSAEQSRDTLLVGHRIGIIT